MIEDLVREVWENSDNKVLIIKTNKNKYQVSASGFNSVLSVYCGGVCLLRADVDSVEDCIDEVELFIDDLVEEERVKCACVKEC